MQGKCFVVSVIGDVGGVDGGGGCVVVVVVDVFVITIILNCY